MAATGSTGWDFTIIPWVVIGILLLIVLAWAVADYLSRRDRWTWRDAFRVPSLRKVDVKTGIAPVVPPARAPTAGDLDRWVRWVPKRVRMGVRMVRDFF
jgi:hypothetical protein